MLGVKVMPRTSASLAYGAAGFVGVVGCLGAPLRGALRTWSGLDVGATEGLRLVAGPREASSMLAQPLHVRETLGGSRTKGRGEHKTNNSRLWRVIASPATAHPCG